MSSLQATPLSTKLLLLALADGAELTIGVIENNCWIALLSCGRRFNVVLKKQKQKKLKSTQTGKYKFNQTCNDNVLNPEEKY